LHEKLIENSCNPSLSPRERVIGFAAWLAKN